MDSDVRWPSHKINPATPVKAPTKGGTPAPNGSFAKVWQETVQQHDSVRFSAHALQRLETRAIELGESDLAKINRAVTAAGLKGARSSLLLYNDLAMVANIRNKTIITAMNGDELREHIFTNIDSAVIIK